MKLFVLRPQAGKGAGRAAGGFLTGLLALVMVALPFSAAWALGHAEPWQITFQEAASPIMEQITRFHHFLFWLIVVISLFVLALMVYCFVRFNARANPVPSTTTHNTVIEVAWTVVPIIILVVMAIPSFRLLYAQRDIPPADMTIKATGNQWYWSYEYPEADGLSFDSILLEGDDLAERRKVEPATPRLLGVDHPIVVPVDTTVRMLVTGADVIHDWAMPSFGIKMDAIPGRVNETWFRALKTGTFYGQCSELCGSRHAFMPIEVRVVSKERYDAWLAQAKAGIGEATKALLTSLNDTGSGTGADAAARKLAEADEAR